VVHRRLTARAALALTLALASAALIVLPQPADGASRRVEVSSYRWSPMTVTVDLGERVTWHWTGPDLMHTVTGSGEQSAGIDSDPGQIAPTHRLGHTFSHTFSQAGTYEFNCKIHTWVGGTVTVTSNPGDPDLDPDPIPPSRVDLAAPRQANAYLGSAAFGRRGTTLYFELDEPATAVAEIWRVRGGQRASGKVRRRGARSERYVGYQRWGDRHIGINEVVFGARSRKFKARPGRYAAYLYLTDLAGNESEPFRLSFRVAEAKRGAGGR
jgi:plastocyanin